jgi:hypothetical protein
MKILFAGSYYYPLGGASDIKATNVKMKGLKELLDAFSADNDWWHVYDTTTQSIVAEGKFEKPKAVPGFNGATFGMNPTVIASC